jgi:acyl-CoA synthetase (AMP-forming)/AMP-acid ligase II
MSLTGPRAEAPSLPARIRQWATSRPDDVAFLFLADGESESSRISFGELHEQAERLGGRMMRAGLSSRPVLLPAPTAPDFIVALCACLYAGVIAVPCPIQVRNRGKERIRSIVRSAGIVAVLGTDATAARHLVELMPGLSVLPTDALADEPAAVADYSPLRPALLQFTSGSTSAPKGVVITHRNLTANILMLSEAFGVHTDSRVMTWLPLFHDMGLIGNVLPALYCGVPCVVMPPLMFLQKPRRWLEAIDRHRITISGAPNFAYELCVRRRGEGSLDQLDLSSWELALCGAEPVRVSTMRRFADAFAGAGFREGSLYACYGLAEATVFVSGGRVGEGVRALPADAPIASPVVSCGRPPSAGPVTIVDPDTCEAVPDGREGEIWVQGEHIAAGYWNDAAATAATFSATLPDVEGMFLRTGDLGLKWKDEIYVTGRRKNLIIHRGMNLHPEDIEATIAASHPGFGIVGAAFAIEHNDEEQVVVVYEVPLPEIRDPDARTLMDRALDSVALAHGVRLFDLLLVRPGAVPRTTSGKVQREDCRRLYLSGDLARVAHASGHPLLGRYQASVADKPEGRETVSQG